LCVRGAMQTHNELPFENTAPAAIITLIQCFDQ
jgi:hypothetical protein